jgi:putative aldouronate transport system substrate-binding protein
MEHRTWSRRGFLTAAVVGGAAPILAACSSGGGDDTSSGDTSATGGGAPGSESAGPTQGTSSSGSSANGSAGGPLPAYKAYTAIAPDIPSTDPNIMAAYFNYPKDPKQAVTDPPAAGLESVTTLTPAYAGLPTPMNKNKFWQQLNKSIGATMDISWVPDADFSKKFATVIAGNDVPDLVNFSLTTPNALQVLQSLFEDLTPYVAGDAINDYPFLAAIPTLSWRYGLAKDALYTVPQPRPAVWRTTMCRTDIFSQRGANPTPASFTEFFDMMKAIADEKKSIWAASNVPQMVTLAQQMRGAPNQWSVQDGTFVSAWADEKSKDAISDVTTMWKAGVFHPDSFTVPYAQHRTYFIAGRTAILVDGFAAWPLIAQQGIEGKIGYVIPPKYDGGGVAMHLADHGAQATTAIKKGTDGGKIKKILAVLNWLAAPIGTAEYLFRSFGIEGTDFTWEGDTPTLTGQGKSEVAPSQLQYIVNSPYIIGPGPKSEVTVQNQWNVAAAKPGIVDDPSVGLYSETNQTKGSALSKIISDAQADIVQGHKPLSYWDDVVKKWKSSGGDQAAKEYSDAYAQTHK